MRSRWVSLFAAIVASVSVAAWAQPVEGDGESAEAAQRIVTPALPPAGLREPDRRIHVPGVDWIGAAAFTPDGERVIAWCVTGEPRPLDGKWHTPERHVRLLEVDLRTGFVSGRLPVPDDPPRRYLTLSIDHEGRRLIVSGRTLIDARTREEAGPNPSDGRGGPYRQVIQWHVYDLPGCELLATHERMTETLEIVRTWALSPDGAWLWTMEPTEQGWRLAQRDPVTFEPAHTLDLAPPVVPTPDDDRRMEPGFQWFVDGDNDRLLLVPKWVEEPEGEIQLTELDLTTGRVQRQRRLLDRRAHSGVVVGGHRRLLFVDSTTAPERVNYAVKDILDLESLKKLYTLDNRPGDVFGSVWLDRHERYLFVHGTHDRTELVWRYDLARETWSWPRHIDHRYDGSGQRFEPDGKRMISYRSSQLHGHGHQIALYQWRDDERFDPELAKRWAEAAGTVPPGSREPLPAPGHELKLPLPSEDPRGPDRVVTFNEIPNVRAMALSSDGRRALLASRTSSRPDDAEDASRRIYHSGLWWADLDEQRVLRRIDLPAVELNQYTSTPPGFALAVCPDDRTLVALSMRSKRDPGTGQAIRPPLDVTLSAWDARTGEKRNEIVLPRGDYFHARMPVFDGDALIGARVTGETWRIERWPLETFEPRTLAEGRMLRPHTLNPVEQPPRLQDWAISPGADRIYTVLQRPSAQRSVGRVPDVAWVQVYDGQTTHPLRRVLAFESPPGPWMQKVSSDRLFAWHDGDAGRRFQVWRLADATLEVQVNTGPYGSLPVVGPKGRYVVFSGSAGSHALLCRLDLDTREVAGPRDRRGWDDDGGSISADGRRCVLRPEDHRIHQEGPARLAIFDW